jgi:hypothetical protein
MAKKYHIDYTDVDSRAVSLEIYNDSFAGASTPLRLERDSIRLKGENTKAINGQLLDFTLMVSSVGQYNDLFNGVPTDNLVKLTIDGTVEFAGYIENEVFKESLQNTNIWSIDVSCHSGFRWLQETTVDDVTAIARQDVKSVMQYWWESLAHVGVEFTEIQVYSSVVDSTYGGTTHESVFDLTLRGYSIINADGKGKTLYRFMEEFLIQWNMYMIKQGENIVIQKRDEISDDVATTRNLVTYTNYDTFVQSTPVYGAKRTVVSDSFYVRKTANHEISNGIKQLEITENHTLLDELIDNTTAEDIAINDQGDFELADDFTAEANAAVSGKWYAKAGTKFNVAWNGEDRGFEFTNMVTSGDRPTKDLTLVNNGIYQKVTVFNNNASDKKVLQVSFKITGGSANEDMGAIIWFMFDDGRVDGWMCTFISEYKGVEGSVKCRAMDQVFGSAGLYKRPIPTSRNIGKVTVGEETSVKIDFDLETDLRDLGADGIEQDTNIGTPTSVLGGKVDFIVGFTPLRHGNSMDDNNFYQGDYCAPPCTIKDISVKYKQDDLTDRTIDGNVNTYDSNLNYKKMEKIKVEYPVNLLLAYKQALLNDPDDLTPALLFDDPSWGITLGYHTDLLARYRISEVSVPSNKLGVIIRNTGTTLRIGELVTITGDLAGDYVVSKLTQDVSQGVYKAELIEFKKETDITIN